MTKDREALQNLLETIYRKRGFDFREYRESTLIRRIGRRLRATGSADYEQYAGLLDEKPHEYTKLFDDLTINVTQFFRDTQAFTALETVVFPELIHGKDKERDIRIWSAGCSTGEEAYSVAVLLLEFLGAEAKMWRIRILGSDLDPKAVHKAKDGFFTRAAVEGLHSKRLEEYFAPEKEGFRVKEVLKRMVSFEEHSLIAAPPCTGQNLVLCRNVLIYFSPILQAQVLKHLHRGLRHGGFLLLGKAEAPGKETKGLFQCVNNKAKLYRKA